MGRDRLPSRFDPDASSSMQLTENHSIYRVLLIVSLCVMCFCSGYSVGIRSASFDTQSLHQAIHAQQDTTPSSSHTTDQTTVDFHSAKSLPASTEVTSFTDGQQQQHIPCVAAPAAPPLDCPPPPICSCPVCENMQPASCPVCLPPVNCAPCIQNPCPIATDGDQQLKAFGETPAPTPPQQQPCQACPALTCPACKSTSSSNALLPPPPTHSVSGNMVALTRENFCLLESPSSYIAPTWSQVYDAPLPTEGAEFDNNVVLQYIKMHGAESFGVASGEDICTRKYIFHMCCEANYGTTLMRMIATVKLGMLLNRTVVVNIKDFAEDGAEFFQMHLVTMRQFERRMRLHGCPYVYNDKNTNSLFELGQITLRVVMPPLLDPKYDCVTPIDAIKEGEREHKGAIHYMYLRCGDLNKINQFASFQVADAFQFTDLIWHNPGWRQTEWAHKGILSIDKFDEPPHFHEKLFNTIMRPIRSIYWVLERVHGQDDHENPTKNQFDIMIHLRTRRDHHVYPFIDGTLQYVRETIGNHPNWVTPRGGAQSEEFLKDEAKYGSLKAQEKTGLKIFVTSSQFPPQLFCDYLSGNLTSLFPSLNLHCFFLDAESFVKQWGLPPDLSMHQAKPIPDDWGVAPLWAALVNVWSASFLNKHHGRILCLPESSFCALMRLVGGPQIESYDWANRLNRPTAFWPF